MNFNEQDFKSLVKKYQDNSATEAEKKYIKNELEKNKLINNLLADELENDLLFATENLNNKNTASTDNTLKETTQIKKIINRKFRRIIGISVAIVLCFIFAFNTFVSPIITSMYYNPTTITHAGYHKDFYYNLRTYTELNTPGYCLHQAIVEDHKFANYNLYIARENLFTGTLENTNMHLTKNRPLGNFTSFWISNFLYDNCFSIQDDDTFNSYIFKKSMEAIKKMPQTSYVSATIGFKEPLTLTDYVNLSRKYKDQVDFKWLAVQTSNSPEGYTPKIGFNPNFNDGPVSGKHPSAELYPFLQLVDMMGSKDKISSESELINHFVNGYETHFKSLLKYLIDQKTFTDIFDFHHNTLDFYEASLDYVENNGILIYGMLIYSNAETLTKFVTDETPLSFEIKNVKTSIYSKGTN